jgi:integrase
LDGTHIKITETVYRGKLRKYGKTEGSITTVDLPEGLAAELRAQLDKQKNRDPEGFMFPNSRGGFITKDNYLRRVLYPVAEKLGLPKLNFQVLRRSFSTLAQKHGTVKDIQRQMRHARPDVTACEYMQVIPESVRNMVSGMYAADEHADHGEGAVRPARDVDNRKKRHMCRRVERFSKSLTLCQQNGRLSATY